MGAPPTALTNSRPVRSAADGNQQLSCQLQTTGSTHFSEGQASSFFITQDAIPFDDNIAYSGAEADGSGDPAAGGTGGSKACPPTSRPRTRRIVARCSSHNSRLSAPTVPPSAAAATAAAGSSLQQLPMLQGSSLIRLSGPTSRPQRQRSVDNDDPGFDAATLQAVLASPRSSAIVSAAHSSASGSTGRQYSGSTGRTLSGRSSIPTHLLEGFGSVVPLRQATGDDELSVSELMAGRASCGVRGSAPARETGSFSLYTREPAVLSSWTNPGSGMGGRGLGSRAAEPTVVRQDILLKLVAEPSDEVCKLD